MPKRKIIINDPEVTLAAIWMFFNNREIAGEQWMEKFPFTWLKKERKEEWNRLVDLDRQDPHAQITIQDEDRARETIWKLRDMLSENPDDDIIITESTDDSG
jgi:hypothetical protein